MVSTSNLDEKFNRVRRNFCFYLDIQDHGLARSISRRIQDMGLHQEVFLSVRVTHVIRGGGPAPPCRRDGRRADAMLQRVRAAEPPLPSNHKYVTLTVQKAINLLDKLYDTFFAASRKSHVKLFTKNFIKIEFLDKLCRPVYKEFDEWPTISLEPDPPREKKEKRESLENFTNNNNPIRKTPQKMTRKSRPRPKERERTKEAETRGGYCEMCNAEYADAASHRRSPQHLAFVRDHDNFVSLDRLIRAGADVAAFLDKAAPLNGERRSQRKMCNGEFDTPKSKRSKRSQSPDSTVDGDRSPRRNGIDDERKHNTRCGKKASEAEDGQYYKVVGVSTKLRSSGGFATKRKESPPTINGVKPLVVKFRKVRRSELSVLSDEAEQFMFPKRASSTSSASADDTDDDKALSPKRKTPPRPPPPTPAAERRRLARPIALKEESSEEDSWSEDKRRRKRRGPVVPKRPRRVNGPCKTASEPVEPDPEPPAPVEMPQEIEIAEAAEVSPLRETEKCMKWEDGRLKYTPAVEQLEFAFESVPAREPWFETFQRQDRDKVLTRNVPQYFAMYSGNAAKLPYEIGQLPPLKPNCCPLSDLVKQREEKAGPSRSYGTRQMKRQKIRKRTAAVRALEAHPRKSPREHASTLAILGSAGLLHRRKLTEDTKSTASEDTIGDTQANLRAEPAPSETQEASERLRQFLSEVFEDSADFDLSDGALEGEATVTTSNNVPDVSSLVSECEDCDLIRNELKEAAERPKGRRGKFKKKNRTGRPSKRKNEKASRTDSVESHKTGSLDRSSAEPPDDETTQDMISEDDISSEAEEKTVVEKSDDESEDRTVTETASQDNMDIDSSDKLLIDLKVVVDREKKEAEKDGKKSRSTSESEDKELKKKKRVLASLCDLMQPVVRVARVDATARRLRSAARGRTTRYRL